MSIKQTLFLRDLEGIQGLTYNLLIIAVGWLSQEEIARMQSLA